VATLLRVNNAATICCLLPSRQVLKTGRWPCLFHLTTRQLVRATFHDRGVSFAVKMTEAKMKL